MEEPITTDNKQKRIQKPIVSFEHFEALDIRLCRILSVEKVEKTDKLYKMEIDTGFDKRVVVSSIAHIIEREKLEGELYPFVLNFAPMTIRKIESQAMILLASNDGGRYDDFTSKIGDNTPFAEPGAIII